MLQSLRCAPMLAGYRGGLPSDTLALQDAVLRLSALVTSVPEIHEIEINPLSVLQKGVRALDIRVRIGSPRSRTNPERAGR